MRAHEYIRKREARIFMAGWWGGFGFACLIFIPVGLLMIWL